MSSPHSAAFTVNFCLDFFQRQKDGGKTQDQRREWRSSGGGLIPVEKQMSFLLNKGAHARTLITELTPPTHTHATINVNALAASKKLPCLMLNGSLVEMH